MGHSEKNHPCTVIEELFRPVGLFFVENLSPGPVRLLKTARLLETSEYLQYLNNFNFYSSLILIVHLFGLTVSLTTKCW